MDVWKLKNYMRKKYLDSLGGPPDMVTTHTPDDDEIAYVEHRQVSPQIDRSTRTAPNQDGEYYQGEE
jgi:hypothetical protein